MGGSYRGSHAKSGANNCATMRRKTPIFKILIDTCVWLDLAKDYHQQAILTALEELIREKEISLILPRTVVDEFARNPDIAACFSRMKSLYFITLNDQSCASKLQPSI
jgi:hypothetical protein